ncbi:MAG: MYXO-CTERM sorting domain-containing protein, partial [Myxococcales bacterium]|nr:MYXO-CTERM sorting domain-containing protein [Myxococcales bacterium]
ILEDPACAPGEIGCHSMDADWFHREGIFDGVSFDSGWLPGGSPVQLRVVFFAGGATEVGMGGRIDSAWPTPITVQVPGRPGTGYFAMDYGFEYHIYLRFDVNIGPVRYRAEEELPISAIPSDLRTAAEAFFDPFILPPTTPRPIEISDRTARVQVVDYGLGGFGGLPINGGARVDALMQLATTWQTDRILVADAAPDILAELETTLAGPDGVLGFGAAKDLYVHPEGTIGYTGTVVLYPVVYAEILGRTLTLELAEIPFDLVDLDSNVIFDDVVDHVPLPDVQVTPTEVDFGAVEAGGMVEELIQVRNAGEAELRLAIDPLMAPFATDATFLVLPPSSTRRFTVRYSPLENGAAAGTASLRTNDPDAPRIVLRLAGEGFGFVDAPDAGMAEDGGLVDAGIGGGGSSDGGCGCRVPSGGSAPRPLALLGLLGLLGLLRIARRRR